jgi:hypothetical protein
LKRIKAENGAPDVSDCDPLDLIKRDFIASAIVELGGARAFK